MPRLVKLPVFSDPRGELALVEWRKLVPFEARRIFVVRNVPAGQRRGGHAHREAHQLLFCAAGEVTVGCFDGKTATRYRLSAEGNEALLIPPMVWADECEFSPDAALVVVTSHDYDEAEYIKDRGEFYRLVKG